MHCVVCLWLPVAEWLVLRRAVLPPQVLELQCRLEAAQHRERTAQADAERLRWGRGGVTPLHSELQG